MPAPTPPPPASPHLGTLGRLAGGVAHDFNNLLGTISNNAYLLRDHAPDAEAQALLDAVQRAVDSGSQLTQHLLRLAHGRVQPPRRIDLARALPEMQGLLATLLGRRVALSVHVEPGTPAIHVDPGPLELALLALGLDARDAMPGGGVGLQLHAGPAGADDLKPLDPRRAWVTLRVTSESAGLAPEQPGWAQVLAFCEQAGGTARRQGGMATLLLPAAAEIS